MASDRRIDVPEKVGGPALCVNAERLGRDRDGELFSDGRRGGSPAIPFKVNDGSVDSASAYTMTSNVTPVNDPAMSTPPISGNFLVGNTLTASTSGITEPDGLPRDLTYSWKRFAGDGTTFEANIGRNSNKYTLGSSEER